MKLALGTALASMAVAASALAAQNANPMDSIRKLPSYRPAYDTIELLAPMRIQRLVPQEAGAWRVYLAGSRAWYERDTAAMGRELRAAGKNAMSPAPYTHDFSVKPYMTDAWFATDSARRMGDVILSYQAPEGGWSKHVDFTNGPRRPGQSFFSEDSTWSWISTIDNDATTEEIHFLARLDHVRPDPRYATAIRRATDYLLASQYPNGCFPQVYPLEGSYHDAATFNDDATSNALAVLREVARGDYPGDTPEQRKRASAAFDHGIECILRSQVKVNGRLTAWGQQHDPLTLEPTSARSYELTSLTTLESASLVDLLMSLPAPSARVVKAIDAAIDWMRPLATIGRRYEGYVLSKDPTAPPLWGRLIEMGTNRTIMANRDGIKLYDWDKLTDRRSGYGWYTTKPAETIAAFDAWSKTHPRPAR